MSIQKRSKFLVLGNHKWWIIINLDVSMRSRYKVIGHHLANSIIPSIEIGMGQFKFNFKTMLVASFSIDGVVHHDFTQKVPSVNNKFYKNISATLLGNCPEKWCTSIIGFCTKTVLLLTGLSPHKHFYVTLQLYMPTPFTLLWPGFMWLLVSTTSEDKKRSLTGLRWRDSR